MGSVTMPSICNSLRMVLEDDVTAWLESLLTGVGSVLVAAAAIYLAFVGWRAFRASTNKV